MTLVINNKTYEAGELIAYVEKLEKENEKAKEIMRSLYSIIQYRIDYENNIGIADEMWRAKQFFN